MYKKINKIIFHIFTDFPFKKSKFLKNFKIKQNLNKL
jgi:hypothetical protein